MHAFFQLSVSNLLCYYSKLNQWTKNWASNETCKLSVFHPSRFFSLMCNFGGSGLDYYNVFWVFSGSVANICDLSSRQLRERIIFMIWALKTMDVTPLYSIRTAVMNIWVVHIIAFPFIYSQKLNWLYLFYHWFLLQLKTMSFFSMSEIEHVSAGWDSVWLLLL